ncbi:hypothetical protein [Desulfuromonas sp. TF]|uniref:hypothetical protein n=1 Tax=Desulfuromonas sp. TF TaxID=1232410 RepID=UPI00041DCB06|nr:hypothetical protein [Desulfuromonas sp. TF]
MESSKTATAATEMSLIHRASVLFLIAIAFVAFQFWGTEAQAYSSFYSSNCGSCHVAATTNTCNGCHHHGPKSLKGTTDKASYAPGETVSVTISGGNQKGWFRAVLYDQNNKQVAISNDNASGFGHAATYPAVLSAAAPTTPGTYTWKAAWFGNNFDTNNMNASSHGEVAVNTNSFTVVAPADTTTPVVGTFTLPATATSLTVPVTSLSASDNVGVTGYLVTTSSTKPAASASGWSASAPSSVTAPAEGSVTFYAWAKDAAGNVSAAKSATVKITLPDTTAPVVGTFTLPATATSLTVPVTSLSASDNVGVTGYLVTTSSTKPAASASGWSASAPSSVTAPAEGSVTFYAWAKDAAGNISATKSATVQITLAVTTPPTLTISTLADGTRTNQDTLNLSGNASDPDGIESVTVNGQAVTVNADGSFSTALVLVEGINTITVVATDSLGTQQTDNRTVTYDPSAPVITVSNPGDNSTTNQAFVVVSGNISETGTVFVKANDDTPQVAPMTGNDFSVTVYLQPGVNTIDIDATDLAGNTSSAKRTITYEVAQISVAVTSPEQDITTGKPFLNISGTVADGVGTPTISITMDGITYTPAVKSGRFQQRLTFDAAKQYAIAVTATDEAGNVSTAYRNVIYDPAAKGGKGGGKGRGNK